MYKLSLQRILIIIGICLVGVFFAIPNMLPNQQGGSSLLLQVKMDDVLKDKMSTLEDSVRTSLREHKIRYQDLKSSNKGVFVKISDYAARDKAKEAFRKLDEGLVVTDDANGEGLVTIAYSEQAITALKYQVIDQ